VKLQKEIEMYEVLHGQGEMVILNLRRGQKFLRID
jgi:hypothetical protein